jgi:hypothetical protein
MCRQLGTTISPDLETGLNSKAMEENVWSSVQQGPQLHPNLLSHVEWSRWGRGNSPNVDIHKINIEYQALCRWLIGRNRHLRNLTFNYCLYLNFMTTHSNQGELYIKNDRLITLYSTMLTSLDLTMSSMTHVVDTKAAPTDHLQPQLSRL